MSKTSQVVPRTKKLVMVVDDDTDMRSALALILVPEGYAVLEAKDGRLAEAMFFKNPPSIVISDIRMPNLDGLTLLEKVRKVSDVPFILMTGFADISGLEEAQARGANDFILKPFKKDELLASITLALNTQPGHSEVGEAENLDFDFCRLSIDEFVAGKVSMADIFVRLSESKYIKVAREGSDLSIERIEAYKSKGMHYLYIRKDAFAKYVALNLDLTKVVKKTDRIPKAQKLRLLKHTSEVMLQDVYINGANKEKLDDARAMVEAIISTLSEDDDIFALIALLQTHADYLYAHSLGVALYSVLVAKQVGWTSGPTLLKVSMGGLLHDIGKKEISKTVLEKPRQTLTAEERTLYETHPIRSKEILSFIKCVPGDVIQIAMHHHENNAGRGFPYRLLKAKIHPLAKLVAVVNEFSQLTIRSPGGEEPVEAKTAIERLWELKGNELDPAFVRALMEVFHVPVPADMPKSTLPKLV